MIHHGGTENTEGKQGIRNEERQRRIITAAFILPTSFFPLRVLRASVVNLLSPTQFNHDRFTEAVRSRRR